MTELPGCTVIIDRANSTHDEWLAARRIGASDVASLLGIGSRSAWVTIARMKGRLEPEHPGMCSDPVCPICWGTDLEPAVLRRFARRHPGLRVEPCSLTYRSDAYPWLQASPDALAWCDDGALELVEVKCPTGGKLDKWVGPDDEERVPESYIAQVQTQMLVTGVRRAHLVAMIHGRIPRYVERVVECDEADAALIIDVTRQAWDEVQRPGDPSPRWLIGSENERRAIGERYGAGDGSAVDLDDAAAEALEQRQHWLDEAAALQARADDAEQRAKLALAAVEVAMGDATAATGGGWSVRRRMQRGQWTLRPDLDAATVASVRETYMRQSESRRIDISRIKP